MALPDTASMVCPSTFDPQRDAETMHNAVKGRGADENAINSILGHRTTAQRMRIIDTYREMYNADLITELLKDLKGDYEDLVMLLCLGPIKGLARELRKKLDKETVDEIICCANNWELREIQTSYEHLANTDEFRKDKHTTLQAAIKAKFKDSHGDYLLKLLNGTRQEIPIQEMRSVAEQYGDLSRMIDMRLVDEDIRMIKEAAEPRSGKPNEDAVIDIISTRPNLHLKALYDNFQQMNSVSLVDYIAKHLKSSGLKNALNMSIMAAVDYKLLLIAQLHSCMSGLGTRETTLSRIVGLRSEYDLELLKVLYDERIGKDLADEVRSETSGDYKNLLMTLLNAPVKKQSRSQPPTCNEQDTLNR